MSHRIPHSTDGVSLPPISQIFDIPPGHSQSSTSQAPYNNNSAYALAGNMAQQDSQAYRHSYGHTQPADPSRSYAGLNSGSPAFYDPGLSPNRSTSHSVPCYGTSYPFANRDETPNPTYYNSNPYAHVSSDMHTYGQAPFMPARPNSQYMMPTGQNMNSRQYAGVPAYTQSAYNHQHTRIGEQTYALRTDTPGGGQTYNDNSGITRSGVARENDSLYSDESSSKTRYECTYCGKGFSRPSALKIHVISHTGDKDFVCPEESCRRKFGIRSNMLRHIRLVHQNMQTSNDQYDGAE